MKKLIALMALAAMAACAEAAGTLITFEQGNANVRKGSGNRLYTGKLYVVYGDVVADVKTAYENNTFDLANIYDNGFEVAILDVKDGRWDYPGGNNTYMLYGENTSWKTVFYEVTDYAGAPSGHENDTYLFLSAYTSGNSWNPSVTGSTSGQFHSGSGVFNIPEPTSGLLLLLGVAGLALRRKRA